MLHSPLVPQPPDRPAHLVPLPYFLRVVPLSGLCLHPSLAHSCKPLLHKVLPAPSGSTGLESVTSDLSPLLQQSQYSCLSVSPVVSGARE